MGTPDGCLQKQAPGFAGGSDDRAFVLHVALLQLAAVRVDLDIVKTVVAECFRVHVPAPITPEIELPAIHAERNGASITEDIRNFCLTGTAEVFSIRHFHRRESFLIVRANLYHDPAKRKPSADVSQTIFKDKKRRWQTSCRKNIVFRVIHKNFFYFFDVFNK
jgi:hypothetical protein